jgi:hypothetical protein
MAALASSSTLQSESLSHLNIGIAGRFTESRDFARENPARGELVP